MLSDNIKSLRKNKGYTQEELAARINVVRQTVSKWEKGFSVPDAEVLQRLADVLEVDVKELLGAPIASEQKNDEVVEQLARINEQLVIKNRRAHRIWKTIGIIFAVFIGINILLAILGAVLFSANFSTSETVEMKVEEQVVEIEAELEAEYEE
ncbi:MAG: helix-turn-helix domain-containing protein [Lachnospiraceae bacterium]|nr:helix-turn-helix domain-containing protein [Lachnospiraceae bacterium]